MQVVYLISVAALVLVSQMGRVSGLTRGAGTRGNSTATRRVLQEVFDSLPSTNVGTKHPGHFIVTLTPSIDQPLEERIHRILSSKFGRGKEPNYIYEVIDGFALSLTAVEAQELAQEREVLSVTNDIVGGVAKYTVSEEDYNQNVAYPYSYTKDVKTFQHTDWGVSFVGGPLEYRGSARAWIVDSGIDKGLTRKELNIEWPKGFSAFVYGGTNIPNMEDEDGHGTLVASIVGAKDNGFGIVGVAPGAWLVPVRVTDEQGFTLWSDVIMGLNHVFKKGKKGDVCNISLGYFGYDALTDQVIQSLAARGIKVVIAAGNSAIDAAYFTPASSNGKGIYTIAAIGVLNHLPGWSNYGPETIDYGAPGAKLFATTLGSKGTRMTHVRGTSFAAPHATGMLLHESTGKVIIGSRGDVYDRFGNSIKMMYMNVTN